MVKCHRIVDIFCIDLGREGSKPKTTLCTLEKLLTLVDNTLLIFAHLDISFNFLLILTFFQEESDTCMCSECVS